MAKIENAFLEKIAELALEEVRNHAEGNREYLSDRQLQERAIEKVEDFAKTLWDDVHSYRE